MAKLLDVEARRAAIAVLSRGLMRPAEVAELAGVSLQVVRYWCLVAGVDWKRVRDRRNTDAWRKELRNGSKLLERPSRRRPDEG